MTADAGPALRSGGEGERVGPADLAAGGLLALVVVSAREAPGRADDELMALVLPVPRADLTISLDHDRMPGPVRTPVLTVSPTDDPEVTEAEMAAWCGLSRGEASSLTLTGSHHALLGAADLLDRLRHLVAVTC